MNVLLADPNPAFRRVALQSLESLGAAAVSTVDSHGEALELARRDPDVDVVFVSRQALPEERWPEALGALSRAVRDARLVLVTLFDEPAYEWPALEAGADAVVSRERWTDQVPRLVRSLRSDPSEA